MESGLSGIFFYNMTIPTLIMCISIAIVIVLKLQVLGHQYDRKSGKLPMMFFKTKNFMDLAGLYIILRAMLPVFLLNP